METAASDAHDAAFAGIVDAARGVGQCVPPKPTP